MVHIIDDHPAIRAVIGDIIIELGHKAVCFPSPTAYLEYLHTPEFEKPLAVITDINMPEMSGYELMERISAVKTDLRYIVISGEPHIKATQEANACFYLRKPFRFEDLVEILGKALLCNNSSPSCLHGCGNTGDREAFGVDKWRCPLGCTTHQEGCKSSSPSASTDNQA